MLTPEYDRACLMIMMMLLMMRMMLSSWLVNLIIKHAVSMYRLLSRRQHPLSQAMPAVDPPIRGPSYRTGIP